MLIHKNKFFGERSYLLRLQSAELRVEDGSQREAAYTFGYAAKAAHKMAEILEEITSKRQWYEKAYNSRIRAIELNKFDQKFLAFSHGFAGDDAFRLYELTEDINKRVGYLIESYTQRRESEKLTRDFNIRHARTSLWYANTAAKILGQIHPNNQERTLWHRRFRDGVLEFGEKY